MTPPRAALRHRPHGRRLEVGTFPAPGVLPFTALLWSGLFLAMTALTFAIDRWGVIESSVWASASQPIRWGMLVIGVWVVQAYLAPYIAHGVTRRSFGERTAVFAVLFAALIAGLSTLGFVIEGWIYDLRDWPQEITDHHLFDDADHLPAIFGAYFLVFLLWCVIGVLNSVAFYREDGGWGIVTVPVSCALVLVAEVSLGGDYPDFVTRVAGFLDDLAAPVGVAVALACTAAAGAFAWGLLRDVPVRPKAG